MSCIGAHRVLFIKPFPTKDVYIRPLECHTTTQDVYIRPQTNSGTRCLVVQDCMNKFNLVVEKGLALTWRSRWSDIVP